MEISGRLIRILALQQGEGRNGPWKKQDYILETNDKIPRKVCFSLWGDKIDQFRLAEGTEYDVSFDLESREFNGRWYTDVKAWKASRKQSSGPPHEEIPPVSFTGSMPPEDAPPDDPPF